MNELLKGILLTNDDEPELGLISLKLALKSYFSTYQNSKEYSGFYSDYVQDDNYRSPYIHKYLLPYTQAILYFQHFSELICKEYLRESHPLLAVNMVSKPETLYNLVHNVVLTDEEHSSINTVEFRETLNRLIPLIKKGKLSQNLQYVLSYEKALRGLNNLRNRIWHRGKHMLWMTQLDQFIGKHILTFVLEASNNFPTKWRYPKWRYQSLACNIDPIDEIIAETSKANPDYRRIGILKELGRASYENPLYVVAGINDMNEKIALRLNERKIKRPIKISQAISENNRDLHISDCPVCGADTLVIYHDTEIDEEDFDNSITYVYTAKCECCTFELDDDPKQHNISLKDYWSM